MKQVTNYIVKSSNNDWDERYILPQFRDRMNELLAIAEERGYEPLLIIGKDGRWWNDEIDFVLDRMSDGEYGGELREWAEDATGEHPLSEGETREIVYMGNTYSLVADTDDLSEDGLLSNDCEPIGKDEA